MKSERWECSILSYICHSYPRHFLEDIYFVYKSDALVNHWHWTNTFGPASPTPFGPAGPSGPLSPGGPWYSRGIKHVSSCPKVLGLFNKLGNFFTFLMCTEQQPSSVPDGNLRRLRLVEKSTILDLRALFSAQKKQWESRHCSMIHVLQELDNWNTRANPSKFGG